MTDQLPLKSKIVHLSTAPTLADIPHAFGGALALAWCVPNARGTQDIDVNVLVGTERAAEVLRSLPG